MNNQQFKNAENFAETFLKAYKQEIFKYRWHIFFSAYLESVLSQNKYDKIIKIVRSYQLLEKDRNYQNKATYIPTISWYYAVSAFKEGLIDKASLTEIITEYLKSLENSPERGSQLENMIAGLRKHMPTVLMNLNLNNLSGN